MESCKLVPVSPGVLLLGGDESRLDPGKESFMTSTTQPPTPLKKIAEPKEHNNDQTNSENIKFLKN